MEIMVEACFETATPEGICFSKTSCAWVSCDFWSSTLQHRAKILTPKLSSVQAWNQTVCTPRGLRIRMVSRERPAGLNLKPSLQQSCIPPSGLPLISASVAKPLRPAPKGEEATPELEEPPAKGLDVEWRI